MRASIVMLAGAASILAACGGMEDAATRFAIERRGDDLLVCRLPHRAPDVAGAWTALLGEGPYLVCRAHQLGLVDASRYAAAGRSFPDLVLLAAAERGLERLGADAEPERRLIVARMRHSPAAQTACDAATRLLAGAAPVADAAETMLRSDCVRLAAAEAGAT